MNETTLQFGPTSRELVGISPQIKLLRQQIVAYASANDAVLIVGETGTGKELVARGLHYSGRRKDSPFLVVNCNMFTSNSDLLGSELFGHKKGAFTGAASNRTGVLEEADEGTVFLDEIGDIPKDVQGKLLRAIENREIMRVGESKTRSIRCRFVAATNKPKSENYNLRNDLRYRFPVTIQTWPLRDRKDDILLLLVETLDYHGRKAQKNIRVPLLLLVTLLRYDWPGNFRELMQKLRPILEHCSSDATFGEWMLYSIFEGHESARTPALFFDRYWLQRAEKFKLRFEPDIWLRYVSIELSEIQRFMRSTLDDGGMIFFNARLNDFIAEQIKRGEEDFLRRSRTEMLQDSFFLPDPSEYIGSPSLQFREFVQKNFPEQRPPSEVQLQTVNLFGTDLHPRKATKTVGLSSSNFRADYRESLSAVKLRFVQEVFELHGRNYVQAARALGMNRGTLKKMIKDAESEPGTSTSPRS